MTLALFTTALAKTSSETIDTPAAATTVFTVKAGTKTVSFTWNDVNGAGKYATVEGNYGAKDADGNPTLEKWSGVSLAAMLADVESQTGVTFADDYKIKTITADNYSSSFTVGDVRDAENRYIVAGDPVKNFDGDTIYDNSYVRILCGTEETLANQANIRCLTGIEILDAAGKAIVTGTGKTAGGDIENAVFYIAVQESATSALKYYYYTMAELEAYGETHAFNYIDHSVAKTVTAKGASLKSLLGDIADADITDDMIVQYAEADGYHADQKTAIEDSEYKDMVAWLSEPYVNAGGETQAAADTVIAFGINEQYAKPDENNKNDAPGVYKDADNNSGYLRAYRQKDSANPAVIKYLMGAVVSYNGQLFTGKDGYTLEAVSVKNAGTAIKTFDAVTGLVPGMKYAVKAPAVPNATLSASQAKSQTITAVEGTKDINVQFKYDESPYFTVTVDGTTKQYVYSDFLTSADKAQAPTADEGAAAIAENKGSDIYGYYDTMLYRYSGVWLADLLGDIGDNTAVTLSAVDGKRVEISADDIGDYFVAYNNTQSKSSTNVPEGKRVTVSYNAPKIIIPADGVIAVASSDTSALIGEKGEMVTVVIEAAAGASTGTGPAFTDIAAYGWAQEAINYLAGKGIVNGVTATTFAPGSNITRADFMLMLYRAYDLGALAEADGNFADVASGAYYYDAVAIAKALGIAKGDGVSFNPTSPISRQEAMTLLFRTLEVVGADIPAGGDLSAFSDSDKIADWAVDAITALVGAGVINGADGKINPAGSMTRAEMAQALYKAITKIA